MTTAFRVLVVGGAGVFGSRLVDAIGASTDWEIVVAGRDQARTESFVTSRAASFGVSRVSSVILDATRCTQADLAATGAVAVVDAAGPFQGAGYALARAAIEAGCHYADIADARAFVVGFGPALDAAACAAGVVAVSGASSTPCLSNAALDALTRAWSRIDTIIVSISPGNRSPRGLSMIAAILSFVGQDLRVFRDGQWSRAPGWGLSRRALIPGLGRRWLSLCDTPDLDILPSRFRVQRTALFLAGLQLPLLHLGLLAASFAVRSGLLPSLRPLAGPVRRVAAWFERFGSSRGGMLVEAAGLDASGQEISARWSLFAYDGDGPSVPVLPALAFLRGIAAGRITTPGAGPCVGMLGLDEIEAETTPYKMKAERIMRVRPQPLLRSALGEAFDTLPDSVRDVHRPGPASAWVGGARIQDGATLPGRIAARLLGFPRASDDAPVRVTISTTGSAEIWTRESGTRAFRSRLSWAGRPDAFEERLGLFTFDVACRASRTGILMRARSWRIGIVPLPRWLIPDVTATESADPLGGFCIDVTINLPLGLGRIVRCVGTLQPEKPQ